MRFIVAQFDDAALGPTQLQVDDVAIATDDRIGPYARVGVGTAAGQRRRDDIRLE